jgi:outer membrane biosynthesis protein TonB
MEIRCGSCNKLFRVADEKITGSGIKFACTRCGEYVKITREDFERYNLAKAAAPVPPTLEPTAPAAILETAQPEATGRESAPVVPPVKGPEPPVPPAAEAPYAEPALPVTKPAPGPEPGHMIHPGPEEKQIPEAKPVVESKPEPLRPTAPSASRPERAPSPARPATTAAEIIAAEPLARASSGKKYLILVLLLFVLGAAAFFILRAAGYNVFRFTRSASKEAAVATKAMTSPEGLQIASASGSLDQNQDLIISGVIENTTDKEKAAWYVVVDVYDAQGTVLMRARMLNGKQLYTKKDYEVLAKRGVDVQELKTKGLQDPGVVIPPKGSVRFEIRFMEPPIGIASFNATLQPFDPEQLFKEIAEEQK